MTDWEAAVLGLAEQVEEWTVDFHVRKGRIPVSDTAMVPVPDEPLLEVEVLGRTVVRLEPTRFAANRLPTVVNLYAYPTLRRVRLVGPTAGTWEVQSGEGVAMKYGWNKEDFTHLLIELANESVPSRV